jgi:hypothetical protein
MAAAMTVYLLLRRDRELSFAAAGCRASVDGGDSFFLCMVEIKTGLEATGSRTS